MPLYEYQCHKCGQTFEVLQRFSDKALTVHEGCGGDLEKLLSPPALQFKGTGWYVTDYAHHNGSSPDHHKNNGKSAETKSEPAKSDSAASKPAASKTAGDK